MNLAEQLYFLFKSQTTEELEDNDLNLLDPRLCERENDKGEDELVVYTDYTNEVAFHFTADGKKFKGYKVNY